MQYLHAHQSCTKLLHEFINMIQHDMLLVKPNNPNNPDGIRRMSSKQVHMTLNDMLERCKDPTYVCNPEPSSDFPKTSDDVVEVDITDSAAEVLYRKRFRHYDGPIQERSK